MFLIDMGDSEDWCVPASDGENDWEPDPKDIVELYFKLDKEKVLDLEWKVPGRRPPDSEKPDAEEMTEEKPDKNEAVEETAAPTAYDFDDIMAEPTSVTPRRTPGSAKPRTQKRVARMDKILADVFHIKKDDKQQGRSPRSPASPKGDITPQRPRIKQGDPSHLFSTPGTPQIPSVTSFVNKSAISPLSTAITPRPVILTGSTPNKSPIAQEIPPTPPSIVVQSSDSNATVKPQSPRTIIPTLNKSGPNLQKTTNEAKTESVNVNTSSEEPATT